ncbi:MAG TPA: endonuclease/exonuclease/phosphatase family protein [Planctomycetota bacterium]|jgi:hypothetical protein
MLSFLFWNLHNKSLLDSVARIVLQRQVDVLIFVESGIDPARLLPLLNQPAPKYFYHPPLFSSACQFFASFDPQHLKPLHDDEHIAIRGLFLPGRVPLLITAAHLQSKLEAEAADQRSVSRLFVEQIARKEAAFAKEIARSGGIPGHPSTLVVGDMNMNPFEEGMIGAEGLHGVMTQKDANRRSRKCQGVAYPMFYNPMWSWFGDRDGAPGGTYFKNRSGHQINYFWNVFDQVLLRPALLPFFDQNDLEILTSDGQDSLLDRNGRPDATNASDHLPLFFKLSV